MEKLRIYISLPITGREREAQEHADLVKASLSRQGHTPVSPFEINAGKDATYNDHICHDLHAMLDCDAIYFCEGWQNSCGCLIEHYAAFQYIRKGKKQFQLFYENEADSKAAFAQMRK